MVETFDRWVILWQREPSLKPANTLDEDARIGRAMTWLAEQDEAPTLVCGGRKWGVFLKKGARSGECDTPDSALAAAVAAVLDAKEATDD